MAPTITVIMCTENAGQIIDESVACLQSQTHQLWELIIVDDGSTDDTLEYAKIAELVDHRIAFVSSEKKGLTNARNIGLKRASGEWVLFLDPGSLLATDFMEKMLTASEDAEVALCRFAVRDERHHVTLSPQALFSSTSLRDALAEGCDFPLHASLLHRSVFESAGAFDPSTRSLQNWDFWLRTVRPDTHVEKVNEVLAFAPKPSGYSAATLSQMFEDRNEIIRRQVSGRYGVDIAAWRKKYGAQKSFTWNLLWIVATGASSGIDASHLLHQTDSLLAPQPGDQWPIEALLKGLRQGSDAGTHALTRAYQVARPILESFLAELGLFLQEPDLADAIKVDLYQKLFARGTLSEALHTNHASFVRFSDLLFGRALPRSTRTLFVQCKIEDVAYRSRPIALNPSFSRLGVMAVVILELLAVLESAATLSPRGNVVLAMFKFFRRGAAGPHNI